MNAPRDANRQDVELSPVPAALPVPGATPLAPPPTTTTQPISDPLASAEAADHMQQALDLLGVLPASSAEQQEVAAEAAAHRLLGIAPRDPIEKMIATQMLALHAASIDCARRASLPGQDSEFRREELNLAQKSSRAFAQLVDTFDRRRRGGEQKMVVEHVHVHAGGQAIVGQVDAQAGRPFRKSKD